MCKIIFNRSQYYMDSDFNKLLGPDIVSFRFRDI